MYNEPLLVTTTNKARDKLNDTENEDVSHLLELNPYNHIRNVSRKNSTGGGKMFIKRELQQTGTKDFQNKT